MRVPDSGIRALARAGAVAMMALFLPGEARSDDNPEAGLTQREFNKITEMRREDPAKPDATLDPDAIAQTYIDVLLQHRSAWSQEIEVRPWTESF